MVKLLHLADVGLASPQYVATDALLEAARDAGRTAFRRGIGCALREQVDAVLVAGGLFDEAHLDYDTEQFLVRQLARLGDAGVPCFYAAGPTDPGGGPVGEPSEIAWPASLHRFDAPAPASVALEDANGHPVARIVGAGSAHAADRDAITRAPHGPFPAAQGDLPHVGLLHAPPAASAEANTPPAPVRKAMRQAAYTYWALGGAPHHRQAIAGEAAWYAGPIAGRQPSQAGPQGGLLVTLEAGKEPEVVFRSFAPRCWADLLLGDLGEVDTFHALRQRAARAFAAVRGESTRVAWLARITLVGGCPLAPSLQREEARERLEARLADELDLEAAFVRLRHVTRPVDPARHRGEPHVLGEALALLDRAAGEPALLRMLAPRDLAAGPGEDERGDYLRACLQALDREACARLLRGEEAAQQ